jgi:ABC-type glycerol-3-phosphate transport system substrate-binding protein
VNNDIIDPLDSYFDSWAEKDQFVSSTVEPLRINGKLYAIPYNSNARALIYRKDILAKYGLSVPKTWDEMIAAAREITKKSNKEIFGLFVCTLIGDPRAPQEFISWYFQVSGKKNPFEVTTSGGKRTVKVVASAAQLEEVLNLYMQMFSGDFPACDPNQRGTGWPVEDPGYVAGKWAMAPMGPWLWGRRTESATAKANLENNSAIAKLPYPKDGISATYLEVKPIMMNKYAKDKKAAWDLIKYITSKEKMAQWLVDSGGIPCRKDSLGMDVFDKAGSRWWINGFADELPVAVALVPVNWGPVNEANLRAVNYVIYGTKSVKDAAKWLLDTYNDLNGKGTL